MKRLRLAAWSEARLLLRNRAYWPLFGVFTLLLGVATYLGWQRQETLHGQQSSLQALVRAQWEGQPDRHPHRVAHYGTFAFKPPGPLAVLEPGVDAFTGRLQYLEAHRQNVANFSEAGELPALARLGELSFTFVLQGLWPLVLIVLGHGLWSAEREQGRLLLLRLQGVTPSELALGKVAGLVLAAAPFFGVACGVAMVGSFSSSAFRQAPDGLARLLVLLGWSGLYGLLWAVGIVAVSRRFSRSAPAAGVLLTTWVVLTLVLPRGAAAWAESRVPLPTKSGFSAAVARDVRKQGDAHNPHDPAFQKLKADTLAQYGVTKIEDLPINYRGLVMAYGETLHGETFARHFAQLTALMEAQNALVQAWGGWAPSLTLRNVSTALAGTDAAASVAFLTDAENYRFSFVQRLNKLQETEVAYATDRQTRLSAETWAHFPDFKARSSGVPITDLPWARDSLVFLAWLLGLAALLLYSPRKEALV